MKQTERQKKYSDYLKAHLELTSAKGAFIAMKLDGLIAKTTYLLDCSFLFKYFGERRW